MKTWNWIEKFVIICGVVSILLYFGRFAKLVADTGFQDAVRIEMGSYAQTRVIVMANNAPTTISSASVKRPDMLCFNNSASTLWISTGAAGVTAVYMGVPVLSSATFRLGAFTDAVSGTLDTSGTGDVRCWDGLVR